MAVFQRIFFIANLLTGWCFFLAHWQFFKIIHLFLWWQKKGRKKGKSFFLFFLCLHCTMADFQRFLLRAFIHCFAEIFFFSFHDSFSQDFVHVEKKKKSFYFVLSLPSMHNDSFSTNLFIELVNLFTILQKGFFLLFFRFIAQW